MKIKMENVRCRILRITHLEFKSIIVIFLGRLVGHAVRTTIIDFGYKKLSYRVRDADSF